MDTTVLFKVVYDWPKDMGDNKIVTWYKKQVQDVLLSAHNAFSATVNKEIDKWNAEATRCGLTDDLPNCNDYDWYDTDYAKFMIKHYSEVLERMIANENLVPPKNCTYYIGDELELHMVIKKCIMYGRKDVDVSFYLIPIKELG